MRKILSFLMMLILFWVSAYSQSHPVTGKIVDEAGAPVSGATILIKGTKTGASANPNGDFTINAKTGDVLVITAVGSPSKEVVVTSGNTLSVTLPRQSQSLSEVVVTTALGVKRSSRSTGYSVATVPTEDLTQARATNIANGLSGKVSGLQINTVNNGVNADTRIVLRGERSILGNNQALIVLDNVPVSADYINSLNPDDVESVNILKGANAAALYGSDAANGVIIITSKKGVRARPSITFTHATTIEKVAYFPKLNTRFGAASTEPDSLSAYTGYYGRIPYENQMYGPEYDGRIVALGYPKRLTRANGSTYDTTQQIPYTYKNPLKNFFETGVTVQNGLSYQAGTQNGSYFISGQINNTKGTIPEDKADRYSLRLGASNTYNRFTTSFSVGYTKFITDISGSDYNQARPVYWNVLNTPGEVDITRYKDLNAPFANENDWYNAYYPNPYWQIYNSRVKSIRDDILGSLEMGYKPTDWLSFTYRIGATASNYQRKDTKAGVTFSAYEISDPFAAGNAGSSNPNGVKPKLYDRLNEKFVIQSDFLINLQHKFFNNDLDAKLLLGNSINKNRIRNIESGNGVNGGTGELEIPGLYNVSNLINPPTVIESITEVGKIGAFGSLQLGYKNFLFVEVTGRNDWVSVLDPNNRSFFYPGINTSLVFTDAIRSLKNISWLSYGKLLASYTKVGNVSTGAYELSNTFSQGNGFPYNTTGFTVGNTLANTNLQPELVKSREVGLQLGLLKNRVNLQVTYYDEDISNQTVPIQISFASGFSSTNQNVGNVSNSGVEVDLKLTPFLNLGPVKWNVGGNLALYHSHVDQIDPLLKSVFIGGYTTGAGVYTIEGQPMRILQVTDFARDSLGRIIVSPTTGRPSAASGVVNVGQSTPKVILGLNTSFQYKNFTLNILGEYRGGYVVYNNIGAAMAFTGISAITTATGRQRFIYPNSVIKQADGKYTPNTTVSVDNASNGSSIWTSSSAFRVGSSFITSGDFWKVREVSLSYNIPVKGTSFIKKASLGLVARNLLTFLPKDNVYADPEYSAVSSTGQGTSGNAQGISTENLSPPTRIFGATVSIGF